MNVENAIVRDVAVKNVDVANKLNNDIVKKLITPTNNDIRGSIASHGDLNFWDYGLHGNVNNRVVRDSSLSILISKLQSSIRNSSIVQSPISNFNIKKNEEMLDWGRFELWLRKKGLSGDYCRRLRLYAEKHCDYLFRNRLSEVELVGGSKHMVLSALSQLSKYLGVYREFKRMKEDSGLSWSDSDNSIVFGRIYGEETSGIVDWLTQVREKIGGENGFAMEFLAVSGLRTNEGYRVLDVVRNHGLGGYLNEKYGVLEHFRYPRKFLRRSKNAYLTVVNDEIIERLKGYDGDVKYWQCKKACYRAGLEMRSYDLRKNWASFMVMNGIPESVVDLCQGRVGGSIFQKSYFRPNMLELVEKIRRALKKYMNELGI